MVDERDPVLVENPTSPGCLQVLSMQGAQIVPVESDGEGVIPDKLEALMIRYRPKLFLPRRRLRIRRAPYGARLGNRKFWTCAGIMRC